MAIRPFWTRLRLRGAVFSAQHSKEQFSGGVMPQFDGTVVGFQTGFDAWRFETFDSIRNLVGVSVGYARANGDVSGFVLGVEGAQAGVVNLGATSLSGYWTMIGPQGWYVDTVVQGDFIDGSPHSDRGIGANISGTNFTASIEGGLPIALGYGVALEPQAQFIYQHLGLNGTADTLSSIAFAQSDLLNGRIGMRLKGTFGTGEAIWTPISKVTSGGERRVRTMWPLRQTCCPRCAIRDLRSRSVEASAAG